MQPFLELLDVHANRSTSDRRLRITTNNTDFDCCDLDWLYVGGYQRSQEFRDQVRTSVERSFHQFCKRFCAQILSIENGSFSLSLYLRFCARFNLSFSFLT